MAKDQWITLHRQSSHEDRARYIDVQPGQGTGPTDSNHKAAKHKAT